MQLEVSREQIPLSAPFTITGYTFTDVSVVVARVRDGDARGEGEAAGVYYLNDDADHMQAAIERAPRDRGRHRSRVAAPAAAAGRRAKRPRLRTLGPRSEAPPAAGLATGGTRASAAARHDLHDRAGEDPAAMANKAIEYAQAHSIKLKLTGEPPLDAERVRAVRKARSDVWLGVDANQGFDTASLATLMPDLVSCKVKLVEQPFARGREAELDGFRCPIPVAADESVQGLADIEPQVGRFDIINIKLDKCGGLTEGLAMVAEARRLGLGVMVGNMVGTSLAMAPAWILGQRCDINDLDGTLFIARDRKPSMVFEHGKVSYPDQGWGTAA